MNQVVNRLRRIGSRDGDKSQRLTWDFEIRYELQTANLGFADGIIVNFCIFAGSEAWRRFP